LFAVFHWFPSVTRPSSGDITDIYITETSQPIFGMKTSCQWNLPQVCADPVVTALRTCEIYTVRTDTVLEIYMAVDV
jgi:hypothetical protein